MIFTMLWIIGLLHLLMTAFLAIVILSKSNSPGISNDNRLSVIVAARNEEINLQKLVPALLNQTHSNFEIIIALDRCTDESKDYLSSIKSEKIKTIDIREVPSDWNAKKYALNTAIQEATGEFLVFTDADCIPASYNWLSCVNAQIDRQTEVVIGLSPYFQSKGLIGQYIRFEAFMTAFYYSSLTLLGRPYMAVGRNLAIRKSFYQSTGGYSSFQSINGGDDDLFIQKNANKQNTKLMLGQESIVYTYPKNTWSDYLNQKLRHLSVGHKYKITDQLLLGAIHGSHGIFFLSIPMFICKDNFYWVILFYLFIKLGSYRFAASKMGAKINYITLPLVDVLYAVVTPLISLWSKLEKDIKWKN